MRVTTSEMSIDAPVEAVWAALTEPDLVARWQYGSVLETSWVPGSPVRFTSEWQGRRVEQWGTVEAFEPARHALCLRDGLDDRPENRFAMTYELHVAQHTTMLAITMEDPRAHGSPPLPDDGPDPVLEGLRRVAEDVATRPA